MKNIDLKRSIRKMIVSGMICCCLTTTLTSFSYAVEIPEPTDENGPVARLEETKWYYRIVDGRLQKRLWSITKGVWLTEWEYV